MTPKAEFIKELLCRTPSGKACGTQKDHERIGGYASEERVLPQLLWGESSSGERQLVDKVVVKEGVAASKQLLQRRRD
jgi:hypothetical protein